MWGMIVSLVQGIVTGVVGPAFSYLGKKQDVTLDGFKNGTDADKASYHEWVDYQLKVQALKIQANGWWGPRVLYMIVGGSAALHFAAVMLDSIPLPYIWCTIGSWYLPHLMLLVHVVGAWGVPKLPAPYDTYEGWVVGSLFVVSLTAGPISAATTWLHARGAKA